MPYDRLDFQEYQPGSKKKGSVHQSPHPLRPKHVQVLQLFLLLRLFHYDCHLHLGHCKKLATPQSAEH